MLASRAPRETTLGQATTSYEVGPGSYEYAASSFKKQRLARHQYVFYKKKKNCFIIKNLR